MPELALAAGTVPDMSAPAAVRVAAAASYDLVGLRIGPGEAGSDAIAGIRSALLEYGVGVLDVEVARLAGGAPALSWTWLLDAAAALDARFVLTVVEDEDRARAVRELRALCALAGGRGLAIGLEFMPFTAVPTVRDARDVLEAVGCEVLTLVVDSLHLARSGGSPADLTAHGLRIGWAQLCDAPADGPEGLAALAHEARHERLNPGDGQLPLPDFLAALPPDVPVSLEVQSDRRVAALTPDERAASSRRAALDLLARAATARRRESG